MQNVCKIFCTNKIKSIYQNLVSRYYIFFIFSGSSSFNLHLKRKLEVGDQTPNKRLRPTTEKRSLIEQESALRIERLKMALSHDFELFKIKKEAAEAERDYWMKKKKMLES